MRTKGFKYVGNRWLTREFRLSSYYGRKPFFSGGFAGSLEAAYASVISDLQTPCKEQPVSVKNPILGIVSQTILLQVSLEGSEESVANNKERKDRVCTVKFLQI